MTTKKQMVELCANRY